jgi:hypothetical protein
MATYEITLKDRSIEAVHEADAYRQEGQMTTFFATHDHRHVVDFSSERVASIRTSEVVIIRRLDPDAVEAAGYRPAATGAGAIPDRRRVHLHTA